MNWIKRILLWLKPRTVVTGGAERDIFDLRDYVYSEGAITEDAGIISTEEWFPEITDQNPYNNCTNEAVASIMFSLKSQQLKKQRNINLRTLFSRFYLWNHARIKENRWPRNDGVYSRTVLKHLVNTGIIYKPLFQKVNKHPSTIIPTNIHDLSARSTRGEKISFYRANEVSQIKDALSKGYGVYIACLMYDGMISPKDNVMEATGSPRFGHAMAIVEANDITEELKIRNSWSKYWADKGYAYMPYTMIKDEDVIYDIYVIKLYEG